MTKDIILKAQSRKDKKIEEGNIPAVVYGKGIEAQNIQMKKGAFDKIYQEAGESNLISLQVEGKEPIQVLIKEVQTDPVKGFYLHADFYQVDMKAKITTEIPLEFIGESKAVKDLNGILIKNLDALEVECLPGDLVDHIEVDLSSLNTFDDAIKVNDLHIPETIEILTNVDSIVATVVEPRKEEEQPAEEALEEKKKEDGKAETGGEEKKEEEKK